MNRSEGLTRRALAPLAAGAAVAATTACSPSADNKAEPASRQFPAGFLWGAATSAFQIEGAADADGKGASIWDVFARDRSRIVDRSDASVATDSYRLYADDVALLAGANMNAYRFSIAWTRVQPDGAGAINQKGLDYYSRLTDALLAKNIAPYATLFHYDLPQALFEKGGWASRDTAKRFADYASIVAEHLGDRIKNFIIMNEAAVHTIIGHVLGVQAPGLRDAGLIGPVTHHQNLAQGLAIQALRAARSDFNIGTTMALMPVRPEGGWWNLRNLFAARAFDAIWNGAYLDPLLKGSYPFLAKPFIEASIKDGDMAITQQPIEFLGVNYYAPTYIKYDGTNPSHIGAGAPPKGVELDAFGREIAPSGLGEILARIRDDYGNHRLLVTENGCSDPFSATAPAILNDRFRIDYLRRHLEVVKLAMEKGSPVGGYFTWTLVDNWEWEEGYTAKFGLVAMDRKTGVRTKKASYDWFAALAKTGNLAQA
jgi:beta-glucosidase